MTNPTLVTTPFAESGDKNIIPNVNSDPENPQLASNEKGFPPITQQKVSEGGIPPERNDFNGILNLYGQHIVHLNKGLPYEFDSVFASAIGGYPLNCRIMLTNGDIVKSTVPNNTTDPNSSMTGWQLESFATSILPLITGNITSSGNVEYPEFSAYSTIKINNVPLKRPFNMINYFFEKPKDFTWNANGHKFWIDGDGLIQSNIVPSVYDVASSNSPVEYFVSLTGNNTGANPGTDPAAPLRSITRALTLIQTNANANAVIWIQAGSYNDGNTWGSTVSVASNVSIKVWNMSLTAPFNDTTDSVVVLPTNDTTLVWTLDSGNTYKTTRSGAHAVVDFAITNRYGDASFYEKAETLAECNSNAGTWFLDTGTSTLYVHTLNNRAPDSSIQVYVNKTLGRMTTGNYTLYMERLWFYGGTSPFAASIDAGSTAQTLFANKCRFWYGAENGLSTRGTSLNIMYKCNSSYNRDDGFNYHSELGGTTRKPKTIEYKCIAYRNGQKWSPLVLTNQGSTTHDGSDIVRVGCTYFDNGRQCVTDVGGSLSWIMGSKGSASEKRFEGSYYSVFQCAEGKMWLDHCDAAGHDYALACTSGGKIFVRNCNLYPRFYTAQSISNW